MSTKMKPVQIQSQTQNQVHTVEDLHSEADRRVGQVFQTMLIFTTMMVLGPISTYFLSKNYIESNLKI